MWVKYVSAESMAGSVEFVELSVSPECDVNDQKNVMKRELSLKLNSFSLDERNLHEPRRCRNPS